MASLTGNLVAETYKALLKTIDNDILTASEKQITDGLGGGSNVFIDSQGFLRANKYKVTNGLATQFLKADGSLDSNAYLTSITGAQVITALGFTPVTDQRTLTINGVTYNLTANRSWTVAGTAAVWGNITGTLSNQTDLQAALNAKFNVPAGTISQYIRGDGTLATFPTLPGGLPTGGTAGQILAKINSTDYNTEWIDNFATQTKNEVKLGQTLAKGAAVYVSSADGTNIVVSAASNASEALSSKTFGLLETGGSINAFVKCVTFGLLAGLNTSAAQAGDPVWLGVNGTLLFGVANKPVAPANMVYIGVVTRVQSNNGEIFVNVQNGFEIEELHDVLIQSKANNQGLFYESSTGLWKNKSIATALGYTPQAQLSGTGFVKSSGTTISYDNSTYLSTADAAATYLALTGGTLSGNLTISSANPKLLLTDTDNNPDYSIQNYNGTFKISDETNSADRFFIYSTGIGYYNGDFKANKLFVEGGLSTQFIKGDGTLDTNTYLTAASLDGYLAKSGGTMTGDLNFYTLKTTRVGGNAYIRGSWQGTYWGLGAAATGHTIIIDQVDFSTGAYESITDVNLMLGSRTVVHSGNVATYALPITGGTVTGSITATSFVKSGGLSTEFLMADGSVSTLSSPVTGSGSAGYIAKWNTASSLNSSNIYSDGTSIGIAYTTPNKGGYGRTLTGASFGSASFGFEAVSNTTTNGGLIGGLSFIVNQNDSSRIVGSAIQSNLVGTTATNYGADLRFFAKADGVSTIAEVARMTSAGLRVYGTIVKDGGTSSQFLMADGSVTTGVANPVGGTGTSGYLPKWTSANTIANSQIFDNGISVGINTITPGSSFVLDVVARDTIYNTRFYQPSALNTSYNSIIISGAMTSAVAYFGIGGSATGNTSFRNAVVIGSQSSSSLVFNTADAEKMRLFTTGNLLIGTNATDSGFKLDVLGSIRVTDAASFSSSVTATSFVRINGTSAQFLKADGTIDSSIYLTTAGAAAQYQPIGTYPTGSGESTRLARWTSTANLSVAQIWDDGTNIGIGQSPGAFKLDVTGTLRANRIFGNYTTVLDTYTTVNPSTNVILASPPNDRDAWIYKDQADGSSNWGIYHRQIDSAIANLPANSIGFIGGGTSALRAYIALSTGNGYFAGNLMLNTTTDSGFRLDVNGTGRFSGVIYASDNIRVYGAHQFWFGSAFRGQIVNYGAYAGTTDWSPFFTSETSIAFGVNGNAIKALNIATNGAATFSTSVTATSFELGNGQYFKARRSSGNLLLDLFGIESGTDDIRILSTGDFNIKSGGLATLFSVKSNGNVLVNTTTDNGYKLNVNGKGYYSNNVVIVPQPESWAEGLSFIMPTTSTWGGLRWRRERAANDGNWYLGFVGFDSTDDLVFGVNNAGTQINNVLRLTKAGNVSSQGSMTATSFFESSDFRLKTLIEHNPIVVGIENLEAKLYEKNGKIEIGYFAQDAELIMPYAVTKNDDGFLSLSYREVHTAKIARLEQRVAELEKQLNAA